MNEPIFIVGAPRSGTTLTAKILGKHSRIFMPGETHFFEDIYSRKSEFSDPLDSRSIEKIIDQLRTLYARYNEPADHERLASLFKSKTILLEERLKKCGSYEEILSLFMEEQARQSGKSRWGNNAPRDLFHIDDIIKLYPNARIIVCVRDMRDFLLSYKYKWKSAIGENAQRLKRLYHPVVTSYLWKASMKRIFTIKKCAPKQNLLIIHYEDLVNNPKDVTQKMCDVIGEEFEPDMLSVQENNSSVAKQSDGIFTASVGRWRYDLSCEDVWIAQYIAGRELEMAGYRKEQVSISYIKLMGSLFSFPFIFGMAIYANRDKRGPFFPYLYRRIRLFFHISAP